MIYALIIGFATWLILGLILPKMPSGYNTEWEPSVLDKWRNSKKIK